MSETKKPGSEIEEKNGFIHIYSGVPKGYMTRELDEEFRKWGLEINFNKTEYLVVGGDLDFNEFRYLDSVFSKQQNCKKAIHSRINQGRSAINQFNGIW